MQPSHEWAMKNTVDQSIRAKVYALNAFAFSRSLFFSPALLLPFFVGSLQSADKIASVHTLGKSPPP